MAERRMFAKTIIDSDAFLDMPLSAQALYFHLSMRADDDGFINNPKKIQRMVGASDDDCRLLLMKRFIIAFESGVVVIKHWKIHNYIRNDRYKPTIYQEEMRLLAEKENKAYTDCQPLGIPNGYQMDTQDRLGKDRLGKDRLVEDSIEESISDSPSPQRAPKKPKSIKHKKGEYGHVLLTEEQEEKLIEEYGSILAVKAITFLDEYIEMKGYKAKNHYLAIKKWVIDAVMEREPKRGKAGNLGSSFDTDNFFEAALNRSFKTAAEDEEVRAKAEALKERIAQG